VALWLVIDPCVNFGRVYGDFLVYIFLPLIFTPSFTEPEGSLLYSQQPITGPYPEPDESTPHLSTLFL
jgi:hypothetical protein